ncbi:hypothetical protein NKH69_31640 [Mesorhizobium sp. M0976]
MAKTAGRGVLARKPILGLNRVSLQSQLDWEYAMQLVLLIRPVWRQIFRARRISESDACGKENCFTSISRPLPFMK